MKLLTFDIESCTGNPRDGSLCSFGYCLSEEFEIIERGDIVVNPKPKKFRLGRPGEEPKIKLAYEEEVFRAAPKFPQVYGKIKRLFAGDVTCLGFSIGNDVRYLNNACEVYRLPPIKYKYFDMQMIMGFYDAENTGAGLGKLGEKYGIEFLEHKSEEDAAVTLKLLETVCKATGKTVGELLEYYEIVLGRNDASGVVGTYSLAQLYNKKGLKCSKTQGGILLHEFISKMNAAPRKPGKLSGRRVCFNTELEKSDINLSRRMISKIYDLGGSYTGDLTVANTYVYGEKKEDDGRYNKVMQEIRSGRKIRLISEQQLKETLGDVDELEFDDISVLVRHAREKQKNRMEKRRRTR